LYKDGGIPPTVKRERREEQELSTNSETGIEGERELANSETGREEERELAQQ